MEHPAVPEQVRDWIRMELLPPSALFTTRFNGALVNRAITLAAAKVAELGLVVTPSNSLFRSPYNSESGVLHAWRSCSVSYRSNHPINLAFGETLVIQGETIYGSSRKIREFMSSPG